MKLQMETTDLSEYVKSNPNVELIEAPETLYECEKLPFAIETYPELDIGFFSIMQMYKGLPLPMFGFYALNKQEAGCSLEFSLDESWSLGSALFRWTATETMMRMHAAQERSFDGYRGLGGSIAAEPLSSYLGHPSRLPTATPALSIKCNGYPETIQKIIVAAFVNESAQKARKAFDALCTKGENKLTFSSTFHGIIPADTKEKIETADPIFSEMAIVAEAHDWELTKETITRDPLVIGLVGKRWFLIDHFNTTGAEDYVVAKYTNE